MLATARRLHSRPQNGARIDPILGGIVEAARQPTGHLATSLASCAILHAEAPLPHSRTATIYLPHLKMHRVRQRIPSHRESQTIGSRGKSCCLQIVDVSTGTAERGVKPEIIVRVGI